MRETEGERMKADILSRLETIEGWVGFVESRSPIIVEEYRKKLYDRMCEVLDGKSVDENRILLEAGIFSEKIAVSVNRYLFVIRARVVHQNAHLGLSAVHLA